MNSMRITTSIDSDFEEFVCSDLDDEQHQQHLVDSVILSEDKVSDQRVAVVQHMNIVS
jgi:hypothetical protein